MDEPKLEETNRKLAERLFEAFRAVGPIRRRHGFGHAARPGEFQVIHRLSHEEPGLGLRVGDLAAWLGVKPPTVTKLVDALESRELVERYADGDDRRAIRVRLSAAGRDMAESFHERALEESERLIAYLGAEDGERLAELLTRTAAFFAERYGPACPGRCPGHDERGAE
ncbi:MAG: hypothetical protein CVV47_03005 [Spirochaetae bacterium HGW-Spirochaetae-3]|jgi:DNA-binding MarR family transcriptional regulator|nr:MAG: hypothetical protein CVV47_03005 [Spirochaetae bacterium HGW-Spirochaetae-3]